GAPPSICWTRSSSARPSASASTASPVTATRSPASLSRTSPSGVSSTLLVTTAPWTSRRAPSPASPPPTSAPPTPPPPPPPPPTRVPRPAAHHPPQIPPGHALGGDEAALGQVARLDRPNQVRIIERHERVAGQHKAPPRPDVSGRRLAQPLDGKMPLDPGHAGQAGAQHLGIRPYPNAFQPGTAPDLEGFERGRGGHADPSIASPAVLTY